MIDLDFFTKELIPALNRGLVYSFVLIIPSAVFQLCLGILAGALRVHGGPVLSRVAEAYAAVFRGTPLMVQLFIWYFGLPHVGIFLSPVVSAIVGFSLCGGAYHSEYVRGGLLSIKKGQHLAAQALGFSSWQAILHIILPQALRRALPGFGNELIYLIKYSSLAYIITFIELTGEGRIIATSTFRYTEVFLVVGLYYLALVTLAEIGLRKLEKSLELPGFSRRQ